MVTPYTKFEFDSLNHEVFLSHLFFYPLYAKKSTRTSVEQMRKAIPCGRRNTEYFLGGLSALYSVFRRIQFLEPYGKHRQLTEYIRRSRHNQDYKN